MGLCGSKLGPPRNTNRADATPLQRLRTDGQARPQSNTPVVRASVPGLSNNSARPQASSAHRAPRTALTPGLLQAGSSSNVRTPPVRPADPPREGHSVYGHPSVGRFSVQSHPIASGSNAMRFELALETPSGQRIETQHQMYHDPSDAIHGGHSTLGFSDIDLPEEMQGKGIGTMYLAAAAREAKKLGVELVAIDTVVSQAMHTLCERLGMTENFTSGSYELDPDTLLKNCEKRAADKHWQPPPAQD